MENPKISVVVPVYNVSGYLPRVVDSLRGQTAKRDLWEAVFVDDCSSDNSLDLVEGLIMGERNMRVVRHSHNRGLSAARNTAISNSCGEFIAQLDGDDMLEGNALEAVCDYLNDNPQVRYFYSSHLRVDEEGNLVLRRPAKEFDYDALLHCNFISPLKGYEKKVNDLVDGFRDVYAEDWDHALRASRFLDSHEFGRISDSLYLYTQRGTSIIYSTQEVVKREIVCNFLKPYVEEKVGSNVRVFWSHLTNDGFNYYDWEVLGNGQASCDTK